MTNERSSKAERRKAATVGRSYDEIKEVARERSAAAVDEITGEIR